MNQAGFDFSLTNGNTSLLSNGDPLNFASLGTVLPGMAMIDSASFGSTGLRSTIFAGSYNDGTDHAITLIGNKNDDLTKGSYVLFNDTTTQLRTASPRGDATMSFDDSGNLGVYTSYGGNQTFFANNGNITFQINNATNVGDGHIIFGPYLSTRDDTTPVQYFIGATRYSNHVSSLNDVQFGDPDTNFSVAATGSYSLIIDSGGTTFSWSDTYGNSGSGVSIVAGSPIALSNGVDVTFGSSSYVATESWSMPINSLGGNTPANFLFTGTDGRLLSAPLSAIGGSSTFKLYSEKYVDPSNANLAFGDDSVAIGRLSRAIGKDSVSIGSFTGGCAISLPWSGPGPDPAPYYCNTYAVGDNSISIGNGSNSSGFKSLALGSGSSIGEESMTLGRSVTATSFQETSLGVRNIFYSPVSATTWDNADRLLSIGNGTISSGAHNAYTLWKDGSFAYNDDNFENNNIGTEQNMFYFNYGSHDGLGVAQAKRAIRMGSAVNDEWDINSANVGDRSIAIGFGSTAFGVNAPKAQGDYSVAIGTGNNNESLFSYSLGVFNTINANNPAVAIGQSNVINGPGNSYVFGEDNTVNGSLQGNIVLGFSNIINNGRESIVLGKEITGEFSSGEVVVGYSPTIYSPTGTSTDRQFTIGNGSGAGSESDALTILKSGQTGIAIDNFEANSNGNIFQVGDGATGIIGYVDNGTGNWVAVSDERKKDNITDLTYGLNELIQLRPTSFNYKRNNEHTIGFLAQQVLPIIPEAVYGTESEGYGMSYATLTPVIVKAIQELNLKVDLLSMNTGNTSTNIFDSLKGWLGDAANGIEQFFSKKIITRELCVENDSGQTCITRDQLDQLLSGTGNNQTLTPTPAIPDPIVEPPIVISDDINPEPIVPVEPAVTPVIDTPTE